MSGYTVLDLETSGFSPRQDRVVEIGLVHVSDDGMIREHWATLVNPDSDVGPTYVHGITSADVHTAPRFAQIAPLLISEWSGTTLVAHNATIALRFLTREFERAGVALQDLPLQAISTMRWAPEFLDSPSRRLSDCCASAGITLSSTHTAIGNALATAELLRFYLRASAGQPPWQDQLGSTRSYPWPEAESSATIRPAERREPLRRRQGRWLDDVVAKLPQTKHGGADSYLSVLEEAMLDHRLSENEQAALTTAADEAGLSRRTVDDLHHAYLQSLAATAAADGHIGANERDVLAQVAHSLGLSGSDAQEALDSAKEADKPAPHPTAALIDYAPDSDDE